MNFLPVVQLEMRAAAHKPMTYYSRCLIGLVAISTGLGFVIAGFNRALSASSAGQAVFAVLALSGYLLLSVQAIVLTCDCISMEKREGTLGLLFLTDLNGFDVVAGKLAAHIGRSLYGLLAALPAFGFCIILGGVGPADFVKVALALLNTLFYFATLGMLISACVWSERWASVLGGLALLFLGVLLPLAGGFAGTFSSLAIIPFGAMMAIGPVLSVASAPPFTAMLLISHGLGWIFAASAAFLLRSSWTSGRHFARLREAGLVRQSKFPARALSAWVAKPGNPFMVMTIMLAACAVGMVIALGAPSAWVVVGATVVVMHWILKFQAISQSSRMLAARRRSGELELLLTTPYDDDEILRTCLHELKRILLWPTLLAITIDLVAVLIGWSHLGFYGGLPWAFLVLAELVWMLMNLFSLSWTGLYLGLKLTNPAKAAGWTVFYVLLVPWIAALCVAALTTLLAPSGYFGELLTENFVGLFVTFLLIDNTVLAAHAMCELRDHFREIVSETWSRR